MRHPRLLGSPDSYRGENTVLVAPHLDGADARTISARLTAWCDFFSQGPSDLLDLSIVGRTSQRLFDSLGAQTQLRRLSIEWGPFDDLGKLAGLRELADLRLASATSLRSLEPLRDHPQLIALELGNAKRITDYSPIGALVGLRQLDLWSPTRAESIDFVRSLRELRHVLWRLAPRDLDYSPLLSLTWVEDMAVSTLRGSTPSLVDLEWALPGIQRRNADHARGVFYEWRGGERCGDYRVTPDGRQALFSYDIEDFADSDF